MEARGKITVLFVNPSSGMSGDTQSLGNLIESVRDRVYPIVLLTEKSSAFAYFNSLNVECLVHSYSTVLEPFLKDKLFVSKVLTHPWRMGFFRWMRHDLPCVRFVKKTLFGRNIDIVHTNTAPTTMGKKLAKVLKAKHVWHIREVLEPSLTNSRILCGFSHLKKQINLAEARVVISDYCQQYWQLQRSNTWVIRDAVRSENDCSYVRKKQEYLLFCSNYVTKAKGAVSAVRSFGISGLASEGIRLKVVGQCWNEVIRFLLDIAEEYGCADSIDFIPFQSDVKPLFLQAKAFIQPSLYEGLGRTTVEAMFYGCPVVARASGGTLDLIKHGETGWLFNTEEECAELLNIVYNTDQEHIILQAQEFAKRNLSIENYGDKIMEVYDKVLNN